RRGIAWSLPSRDRKEPLDPCGITSPLPTLPADSVEPGYLSMFGSDATDPWAFRPTLTDGLALLYLVIYIIYKNVSQQCQDRTKGIQENKSFLLSDGHSSLAGEARV